MIQKFGNINQTIKKCAAIVGEHKDSKYGFMVTDYCGKPTKRKMVLDEEKNKVWDWDFLCPEHRAERGGNYWSND